MSKFPTTHWSLIAALQKPTDESQAALTELLRIYRLPVYQYVQSWAHNTAEAEDLVQSFFVSILEGKDLARVHQERGRFRNWLLAVLRHFLSNKRREARARKRGGGAVVLSIDALTAEGRDDFEPVDLLTPQRLYERRWAHTLLEECMAQLEQRYESRGQRSLFHQLQKFLTGEEPAYAELAAQLGCTPGALRGRVYWLRTHYREIVRDQIAAIVADPAEVDDELRNLITALS